MKKHITQQLKTVNKVFRKISFRKTEMLLKECLNTYQNGGKIIASGLGKNAPICEKFIGTLNSVGIYAGFLHTHTAIHGDLGIIREKDLVILVSKSGETDETIYLAKILKKRKTNTWLITCTNKSSVQKYIINATILPIDKEGDLWNLIPINSTNVFLIFLNALALALIEQLTIPLSTFRDNHPGGGAGKKLKLI